MERNANYALVGFASLMLFIGLIVFGVWLAQWISSAESKSSRPPREAARILRRQFVYQSRYDLPRVPSKAGRTGARPNSIQARSKWSSVAEYWNQQ